MNKQLLFLLCCFILTALPGCAQPALKPVKIDGIPGELTWVNSPLNWKLENNVLTLTGGKGSRLYTDPQQIGHADSAPLLLFKPDENFLFSAKVKVDFNAIFDAGVLMIYGNTNQWAKFCFEYTPDLEPMMVSVVNNNLSDDSNHDPVEGNEVYMRIAGLGNGVFAFHYSLDGKYWNMLRYFYLDPSHDLKIGFLSQSPRGDICTTVFSEISYRPEKLVDLRNGE